MRLPPFLPRRNPPAALPPRRHLLIGAVGPQKPDTDTLQGKAVCHPIRYGCFLHGAISLDIATGILSILPPILTGSPASLIPARSVLPAMSPGSAWEEAQPGCFAPGGLGGNDGREGGPLPPLRRPVEGAQGLEQAMPHRAGGCDRTGGCRRIHAKRRARSHLACFLAVMPSCPILR